jgi:hypothetical protein
MSSAFSLRIFLPFLTKSTGACPQFCRSEQLEPIVSFFRRTPGKIIAATAQKI